MNNLRGFFATRKYNVKISVKVSSILRTVQAFVVVFSMGIVPSGIVIVLPEFWK